MRAVFTPPAQQEPRGFAEDTPAATRALHRPLSFDHPQLFEIGMTVTRLWCVLAVPGPLVELWRPIPSTGTRV